MGPTPRGVVGVAGSVTLNSVLVPDNAQNRAVRSCSLGRVGARRDALRRRTGPRTCAATASPSPGTGRCRGSERCREHAMPPRSSAGSASFNAAASIRPVTTPVAGSIRTIVSVVHTFAYTEPSLAHSSSLSLSTGRPSSVTSTVPVSANVSGSRKVSAWNRRSSPAGRAACTTPALAVVVDGAALREGVAVAFDRDPVLPRDLPHVSPTTVIPRRTSAATGRRGPARRRCRARSPAPTTAPPSGALEQGAVGDLQALRERRRIMGKFADDLRVHPFGDRRARRRRAARAAVSRATAATDTATAARTGVLRRFTRPAWQPARAQGTECGKMDTVSVTSSPESAVVRPVLADAVELARTALVDLGEGGVGRYLGVTAEDDCAATHRFDTELPGYRGWQWAVVVAAVPGSDHVTVSELALLPGPDALVAPEWLPWDQRVRPAISRPATCSRRGRTIRGWCPVTSPPATRDRRRRVRGGPGSQAGHEPRGPPGLRRPLARRRLRSRFRDGQGRAVDVRPVRFLSAAGRFAARRVRRVRQRDGRRRAHRARGARLRCALRHHAPHRCGHPALRRLRRRRDRGGADRACRAGRRNRRGRSGSRAVPGSRGRFPDTTSAD